MNIETEREKRIQPEEKKCCVFMDIVFLLVRLRNKSKTHDPRPGTKMPSWRNTADGPFGKVQASSGLPRHNECKRMRKKDADEGFPKKKKKKGKLQEAEMREGEMEWVEERERGRMQLRDKSGVSVGRRREELPEKELRCRNRINK